MDLQNKTILITGATSGIGLHLATKLYTMGNKVLISGRKKDILEEIQKQHQGIEIFVCDVTIASQREALASWAINNFPDLNIVVNNAGLMQVYDLKDPIDMTKVAIEVDTNLIAPIHIGSLFTEHLMQQPSAAIVNVTSGLAFTPLANVAVYCATKAALHAFCLSLRYQLRDTTVKVFEIIPPAVSTNLGHADNYDKSNDDPMDVNEFTNAFIDVLQQDKYEIGIGPAESLRQKRDAIFDVLNPQ